MHRLTLLFLILGFLPTIYAAAVFEFPDLTRRLPERTTTPGCAYKGERYAHGDQVATTEPCLNCTCIRAVVVCYLRVCPSASTPPPGCFLAREPGQCCPSLVCGGDEKAKPNEGSSAPDLRPTFQPESAKEEETTTLLTTTTSKMTNEDSLMFVSSTQADDDIPILNDIPGGCLVNGTLYGDGSAMLSSSFCEYCFCIRGKSTCLKPKCDLVIEGCSPHYDSHFSCCPSRYDCYQKTTDKDFNEITEAATTTTTTTEIPTKFSSDYGTCIEDGLVYNQGEAVPDYRLCHNCYCSNGSIVCDKIKCAPALAGCQPIIPEGHCCPVSYKCDYQGETGNYNIKVAKLNDSRAEVESKKTVKQSDYFKNNHSPNLEARPKSPNLINDLKDLIHNFVPVHRRLEEDIAELYHSPEENFNASDTFPNNTKYQIAIGETATSFPRENDKTLDLEELESETETTPLYTQNEEDFKNTSISSTASNTVSVGPPEVQTISIQELFQHRLSGIANISKQTTDIGKTLEQEPKRNNSKQPITIVDIVDAQGIDTTAMQILYSFGTEGTAETNSTTGATKSMLESATPEPQETTGKIATVTPSVYKNLDSTLIHTTLNFAEDEEISNKYGSTPFIVTGTKSNRKYTKALSTVSLDLFSPDYLSTNQIDNFEKDTFFQASTRHTTKLPSRINSKLPTSYSSNDSVLHSNNPLIEDSLINPYLPAEGRDGDTEDFTNVGAIHLGAPLSVDEAELRRDPSNLRNKLTESGGVIFMDPKYTDINPISPTEIPTKSTKINLKQDASTESVKSNPITPIERSDNNHSNDRKKGPRIQDTFNQTNPGQDFKIIPFVAEDAIRGKFGKLNHTYHVVSDATESAPDMVSDFCFIKGRIFMNGEMIPKVDPCELCRCFYGQELCQLQRCPTPPPNCVPEKLPNFCCPRYTCAGNSSTFKEQSPPSQRITINTQGNAQFVRPVINRVTVGNLPSDKPRPTSQKPEEAKFGIRVRLRPTQASRPIPLASTHEATTTSQHTTTTTKKSEPIRTSPKPTSEIKLTTTTRRPEPVRLPTAIQQSRISTTKEPEITKPAQNVPIAPFDPWGLLKVSGCNIYGKFFNINDQVEILSGPCSHCICTTHGVECNDIC